LGHNSSSPYTLPLNSIFHGPTETHEFNLIFLSGSVFPTLKSALGAAVFVGLGVEVFCCLFPSKGS